MNCDQAIPRLSLGAYGELDDGERHELETHLAECPRCTAEWAELQRLKMLLTPTETAAEATRRKEDEEDLLAQFRVHVSAGLDSEDGLASAQPTTFTQPAAAAARHQDGHRFRSAGWPVLAAPLMSLLLIAAGFAGGWLSHGTVAQPAPPRVSTPEAGLSQESGPAAVQPATSTPEAPDAGMADANAMVRVDSVERAPNGGIQIHFDTVEEHSIHGPLSDPRIRQMLLYAAQSPPNSGIRLDSLDVLGTQAEDRQVRQVLIHVLLDDPNPGVRLKALESLSPRVGNDRAVRQAMMQTVLHDSSSGVRSQAVSALSQAPRNEAAPLLRQAGDATGDLYLRLRIAAALRQMQEGVPSRWLETSAKPAITSQ